MAAKSKKRLSKIDNKLLKLEKLELSDVICSICQSILIEPVTLPCFHDFCYRCFNGSVENNAICCPLCRLRIGSWLRKATKQKNLINTQLWNFIKSKFSEQIEIKSRGEEITLPKEKPTFKLCNPGEIRSEYEAELKRLETERLQFEEKHIEETNLLIKKIQREEEIAHRIYLESLEQDEKLALQMQSDQLKTTVSLPNSPRQQHLKANSKLKLKATKIDTYLSKAHTPKVNEDLFLNNDSTYADSSSQKSNFNNHDSGGSPEMVPKYGILIKSYLDKKIKVDSGIWNKENGKIKEHDELKSDIDKSCEAKSKTKSKPFIPSLLVSLPLPCSGIKKPKKMVLETRHKETGSADSMQQELCYFKPIETTTPTSFSKICKDLPIKVPCIRADKINNNPSNQETSPSRSQYLKELCHLRNLSLAENLPSAFVIALNALRVNKENTVQCETNLQTKEKKITSTMSSDVPSVQVRKNPIRGKNALHVGGVTNLSTETNLRRTRSMGSIAKDDNETTPKKAKIERRKASSERKPYLRSDSKKLNTIHENCSSGSINNNKINLVVKNLSSPLKNCDVKKILQEQLTIEKIIEQEKNDFKLAQKMDAEWNGRRQPRRSTIKRQVTLNHSLRPAKKLKV